MDIIERFYVDAMNGFLPAVVPVESLDGCRRGTASCKFAFKPGSQLESMVYSFDPRVRALVAIDSLVKLGKIVHNSDPELYPAM